MALAGGSSPTATAPTPAKAVVSQAPRGYVRIGTNAIAFLPARSDQAAALPLLVLFHGAGSTAQVMMKPLVPIASRWGVALLAIQAHGTTWDLIEDHFDPARATASRLDPDMRLPSGDRRSVDKAIALFSARFPVDSSHVGALGFSDGASYALSIGAFEPERFVFIAGFSPAFALIPPVRSEAARRQRVYITHGRQDRILPFIQARDAICPDFVRSGRTVRFRSFDGDHVIKKASLEEAFREFMTPQPPPEGDPSFRCDR